MKHVFRLSLFVIASSLLVSACDGGSGPASETMPQGEWLRTTTMAGGKEHHSRILLQRDSAFIADTVFSVAGGSAVVDSIHSIELELAVAGDGYYRAVEEHVEGGSDITAQELHYWYFYTKNDSLYFYRGMRLRGKQITLPGSWNVSAADSAFLGESYTYTFTDDEVTIAHLSPSGTDTHTYPYRSTRDSLIIEGSALPFAGSRFEIVPGLALYITSHREAGYAQKK